MNVSVDNSILDARSFQKIADIAYQDSGLQLVSEKTSMIQSRLRKRLNSLGMTSFAEYSEFIGSETGHEERRHMISALTTNVSHFFRESHHFEILKARFSSSLLSRLRAGDRLRIWSAGSSNGQEAYSIAMTLIETIPDVLDFDVRILATDIDPQVIAFAREGVYPERMMNGVSSDRRKRFFEGSFDKSEDSFVCKDNLRSLVRFKELNLLSSWPMKHEMDFIFCRNVVIYFNTETQNRLWPKFYDKLTSNGLLFLGHSERIPDPDAYGFESDGPTTYAPIQRDRHT
jgi:chemotaxis protein methyltransferase CheR